MSPIKSIFIQILKFTGNKTIYVKTFSDNILNTTVLGVFHFFMKTTVWNLVSSMCLRTHCINQTFSESAFLISKIFHSFPGSWNIKTNLSWHLWRLNSCTESVRILCCRLLYLTTYLVITVCTLLVFIKEKMYFFYVVLLYWIYIIYNFFSFLKLDTGHYYPKRSLRIIDIIDNIISVVRITSPELQPMAVNYHCHVIQTEITWPVLEMQNQNLKKSMVSILFF